MAISNNLLVAILAMDAYNRGYNPKMNISGGNEIGTAVRQSFILPEGFQEASFFAQAYQLQYGTTVISYRGTDQIYPSLPPEWTLGDAWNGWGTGLGSWGSKQAEMAVQFYNTVADSNPPGAIVLTGHSLGGGLAGFVASLYGMTAHIYDNMPFEDASSNAQALSDAYYHNNNAYSSYANLYQTIYGDADPWTVNRAGIYGYAVDGEILSSPRWGQQTEVSNLDAHSSLLSPIQKHSMALLVTLLFAQEEQAAGRISGDWVYAAGGVMPALFDANVAAAVGFQGSGATGTATADEKMLMAIAYSAIDDGTRVFGDTSIRALFNDADELGEALKAENVSSTLKASSDEIARILVQFAGQLAFGQVLQSASPEALRGVLTLSDDKQTLAVDFADSLWQLGAGGATPNIIGRKDLTDIVFCQWTGYEGNAPNDIRTGMQWLWNDENSEIIDRIVFATTDDPLTATIADRTTTSDKVTLFAAGGSADQITGSRDRDFIYGGKGNDILKGADGDDLLAGAEGNDRLCGGNGRNFLAGGYGEDTVYYEADQLNITLRTVTGGATGQEVTLELDRGGGNVDRAIEVEKVELTAGNDTVAVQGSINRLGFNVVVDGGAGHDVLDFSGSAGPAYLGTAQTGNGVEAYTGNNSTVGFFGGTGLSFQNFEQVIGSSQNDVMNLGNLSPGGALTAEQQAQISAAASVRPNGSDPNQIAAVLDQCLAQAGQVAQNQLTVTVDGGAGDDLIRGTATGLDSINGGAGDDILLAGGFASALYGGAGNDLIIGGGFKSQLYGGDGQDVFILGNHSFAMDASTKDYAIFGKSVLTGGVQLPWMESQWAYCLPSVSLMAVVPPWLVGARIALMGLVAGIDVATSGLFRFGMTSSDQLIVQSGRGHLGQAYIENYDVNLDTGASTANVTVFQLKRGSAPLEEFGKQLRLVLRAGFGLCFGQDPLVLDLDNDGIELSSQSRGVYFDLDQDGFAERTGWAGSDDALLARDLNGNGRIDDIGELFGNATTPGFVQLAALDTDGDGRITAADADFGTLRVWQDENGNGVTDEGELKTLAEAGIAEISLTTSTPAVDAVHGNTINAAGTFTRTDGTTSTIAEVILDSSEIDSKYLGDTTVSAEAAALPNLKGYGTVTELAVAMTDDSTLLGMVASFRSMDAGSNWEQLKAAATDILFRWAGVDSVAAVAMGDGSFDRQKLAFLENYFGHQLAARDQAGNPSESNLDEIIASWDDVLEKETLRLAAQGPLASLFPGVVYDAANDILRSASATSLADAYRAAIGQLSSAHDTALDEWNTHWAPLLAVLNDSLRRIDLVDVKADYVVQSLVGAVDGITSPLSLTELVNGFGLTGVHIGTDAAEALSRGSNRGLQTYVGGAGNDTLTGGSGQDVFVFGGSFGQDVVIDLEAFGVESGDRIRLATLTPDDVEIKRVGDDLIISVIGTTDTITVKRQFDTSDLSLMTMNMAPDKGIEEIQFADGTVYEVGDIAAAVGLGTDGNDTIAGTGLPDELEGLKGDDLLQGGDDGDIYYFSKGDGNDTIQDIMTNPYLKAFDVLGLMGISATDLRFSREGASDDLVISFGWDGDSITLKGQFFYTSLGDGKYGVNNRIEQIYFLQGTALDWHELQAATIKTYTTENAEITYGFGSSDVLYASAGNDTLIGFDGGDTYCFERGTGQDTIHDQSRYPELEGGLLSGMMSTNVGYSWAGPDTLLFGDGINPGDVTFKRPGEAPDLFITVNGTTDTMTIVNQFEAVKLDMFNLLGIGWFNRVERFQFADGTTLTWEDVLRTVTTGSAADESLYGAMYQDTVDGKEGNDYLSGGDDGDTYIFGRGYGQDVIEDKKTNILLTADDTLKFGEGIAVDDIEFLRDGQTSDLLVSIRGTSDTLRIRNHYDIVETGVFGTQEFNRIEQFVWVDGTVKTAAEIEQGIIEAAKTAGDDTIVGTHFNDVIAGGAGNDRLDGGNGADTYVFNRGDGEDMVIDNNSNMLAVDGDTVAFDENILPGDIQIERYGPSLDNVRFTIAGTTDSLSVEGQFTYSPINWRPNEIESFTFTDGTVWTADELRNQYLQKQQTAGNDTLRGFWQNDTYRLAAGFGQDIIQDNVGLAGIDGYDAIEFGAGITAEGTILGRNGGDLVLTFSGSTDTLTVQGQFNHEAWYPAWTDIEEIRFADGTTWNEAQIRERLLQQAKTDGDDTVAGFFTADVIDGGAGNDTLMGLGGGDTYLFGKGSGQDVIEESTEGNVYDDLPDTISFLPNVTSSEVTFVKVGDDLAVSIAGTTDTLTVKGQYGEGGSSTGVEFFKFADGMTLTAAQVAAGAVQAQSTSGADTVTGTSGNDIIDGGAGNDLLKGADGNDTYQFTAGFGQDVIEESVDNPLIDDDDAVVFGPGLTSTEASFSRSGDDLTIGFQGSSDQVAIEGQFSHEAWYPGYKDIENFAFADGVQLTDAQIREILIKQSETSGDDTVTGFWTDDVIDGGAGNDILRGLGGGDTYIFGKGSGQDVIEESTELNPYDDEPDTISFMSNVDGSELRFLKVGDDLRISIAGASDTLTIRNHFKSSDNAVEIFEFADGSTLTREEVNARAIQAQATSDNDLITGTSGDDTVDGLTGNDTLGGKDGNDSYRFTAGFGQDVIEENVENLMIDDYDDVQFSGSGYTYENAVLSRNGDDLIIGFEDSTDQVTVRGQFSHSDFHAGYKDIESFTFADGVQLTDAQIRQILITQSETAGNDTVTGYWTNDVIDGGAGNDTLRGLGGSDTYIFGKGSGQDVIEESIELNVYDDKPDTIQFSANVTAEEVTFLKVGDDLRISIAGADDTLTVKDHFYSSFNVVESFAFTDGTVLTEADVARLAVQAQATEGNDSVSGTSGDDVLDGLVGNDTLIGDTGDDTYVFGRDYGQDTIDDHGDFPSDAVDQVKFKSGIASTDLQFSRTGNDLIIRIADTDDQLTIKNQFYNTSPNGNNLDRIESFVFADGTTLTALEVDTRTLQDAGTAGNDSIVAYEYSESLEGKAGDDTLDGRAGADTMIGGAGNDVFIVDVAGDVVAELPDEGIDTVQSGVNFTLGANLENLVLTGQSVIGMGNELNNAITGNINNNTLTGGAGNDTLDGGAYSDTMTGGTGDDVYLVDNAGDSVTENADGGTDTVRSSINYTLGSNLENLTLTGYSSRGMGNELDNVIYGNTSSNTLIGGAGNDTLDGGGSVDTMTGGTGDDVYFVDVSSDSIIEGAGEGTDTVQSSATYTLSANVENLVLTGTANINGTGNTLDNILTGNSADNKLNGGTGADTMTGGLGNDTYVVDTADTIIENADEGTDTVQAGLSYTLGANFENLTLTGTSAINGTGNVLDNFITGNSLINILADDLGNDTIDGGAGGDAMTGGTGNDTYVVDNTGDVVTENAGEGVDLVKSSISYTLGANLENLTLTGAAINGTGNASDNVLTGNTGANTLDGGTGADTMIGGLGSDTYLVDNVGDEVTEYSGEGTDTVRSSVDYTLGDNLESLSLTGTVAVYGYGNDLSNTISGNSLNNSLDGGLGNDTIDGGTGSDTMTGGLGDDTYVIDNTGDVVTESAGEGIDTVKSSISYTLGVNLDNLTLTGYSNINGIGNELDNYLYGNYYANIMNGGLGNDTLDGYLGRDTLIGGLGDDTYVVDNTGDVVTENAGEGIDTVKSSISYTLGADLENLTLSGASAINGSGNSLDNVVTGNSGNNTLNGGAGADTLMGGTGNDTYWFLTDFGNDLIAADSGNNLDKVDLSGFTSASATVTVGGDGGDDLIVTIGTNTVTIADWNQGSGYQLNTFVFSDGTRSTNGTGWI